MYIYNGNLHFYDYAINECFTLVFPVGFALHDPVCVDFQWTKDIAGQENANVSERGLVMEVSKTRGNGYKIGFSIPSCRFEAALAPDRRSVEVVMIGPNQERSSPTILALSYADNIHFPTTITYTGKLNYSPYAANEMTTLIFPAGISSYAPVGLYYQFTVDARRVHKRNEIAVGNLSDMAKETDGTITAIFKTHYYRYRFTFSANQNTVSTVMMSPENARLQTIAFRRVVAPKPLGVKKALIIRFDTGNDAGIFLVKDMLTKYLGFDAADVEMLYFDLDMTSASGRRSQTDAGRCDSPTAKRFKEKFISLLQEAQPEDVCFLYVDARGTVREDDDNSGRREVDGMDDGWTFARKDTGDRKEVVYEEWISKTIRENLKSGVNLTILTSSCLGGDILDTHSSAVLLAGCHESQFNMKSLTVQMEGIGRFVVDPWMYAITTVISRRVASNRGVPTYTELFNEAKRYIKSILDSDNFSRKQYLGSSPQETRPLPRNMGTNPITSHQDPQMIFHDGFINPDVERFLFPLMAPTGGATSQGVKARRYPQDEF